MSYRNLNENILAFVLALSAAGVSLLAQGGLVQVGLTDASARRELLALIEEGGPYAKSPFPVALRKKFLGLPMAARRDVTIAGWSWIKAYVNSAAFKAEYARIRASHKPASTQFDTSIEEEVKKRVDEEIAKLNESLKDLAMLPADQRGEIEAQIKKSIEYFRSKEYLDLERARVTEERSNDTGDLSQQLERWNQLYPENSNTLVARHLREFLENSAGVNFNVRLMKYGNETIFAFLEDALKPWQWRESFWAGREAHAAARAAAEAWLKELGESVPVPSPEQLAVTASTVMPPGPEPVNLSRQGGIAKIALGSEHTVFFDPDGTLRTWTTNSVSPNERGEFGIGHNNKVPILTPILVPGLKNVVQASAGYACTFAVLNDGTLLAWGAKDNGQLGVTTRADLEVDFNARADALSPTQPSVSFAATDVSAGRSHVLALAKNGTVYAWGDGGYGRLGIGEMPVVRIRTNAPRTMREVLYPIPIPELTGVTAVSAGSEHSLALLVDGTVRAWGRNHRGQLGDGSTVDRMTPVVVSGVRNAVAVGAGNSISAALLADGTMMTWGSNENGQLGRTGSSSNPTPALVPGVANIQSIAVGDSHVLALTRAGTVISWGDDQFGTTGKNRVKSAVPTVIPALNSVTAVYAKNARSAAVLADGAVRIWGYVPPFPKPIGDVIFSPIPIELLLNPTNK